jgi:hypothetical protein
VLLTFKGSQKTLLPLALSLLGHQSNNGSDKNTQYLQGWTIDHGFVLRPEGLETEPRLKYYKELEDIVAVFQFAPVLHIKDVDLLFKRPKTGWRARRYARVWTLYLGPIHANYQSRAYYSPVIGVFSSIDALLKCVQERGTQVSLKDPIPEKPFELIRLCQISLERRQHQDEQYLEMTQSLINGLRPNSQKPIMTGVETSQVADVSLKPASKHNDSKAREQYIAGKKRRQQERAGLVSSLQAQCRFVDGKPKCELPSCPLPGQRPSSNFCIHHTEKLLEHLETSKQGQLRIEKWQLSSDRLDMDGRNDLQALKELYTKRPNRTWIIDFEFVTLGGILSAIPLQLAIRTIDGRLLLADNVEYNLNLEGLVARIAAIGGVRQSLSSFISRCYSGPRTNGKTPRELKNIIVKKLKYDKNEVTILSWFSVQDMQCFQRIVNAEDDELIVPRQSHLACANFQTIKLSLLLKALLPPAWPSLQLGVVHTGLLHSQRRKPRRQDYHTAEYDTEAVADLVKEIVGLK